MTEKKRGWFQDKIDRLDAWNEKMDAQNAADKAKHQQAKADRQAVAAEERTDAAAPVGDSTSDVEHEAGDLRAEMKAAWRDMVTEMKDGPSAPGHDAETHGRRLLTAELGSSKEIELYEKGFVRVTGIFGTSKASFERLVAVDYRETTTSVAQDQSVVGSMVTNALSLGMASTESVKTTTHGTITVTTPDHVYSGDIKAKHGRELQARATQMLGTAQQESSSVTPAPTPPDITDQIKKLADLHAAGILTDEEFAKKKADLLDRL